jgi:hypothetical protein
LNQNALRGSHQARNSLTRGKGGSVSKLHPAAGCGCNLIGEFCGCGNISQTSLLAILRSAKSSANGVVTIFEISFCC